MDTGTGRFIHAEQDWDVLRRFAQEWAASDFDDRVRGFVDGFRSIGVATVSQP
jgi:hypothetical protein